MKRHGTLNLDPVPTNDRNDPLNWPEVKKTAHLMLIAFQALCTTFFAAGIIPSYSALAEKYNTSMDAVTYLTSAQLLVLGILPFFWLPVMSKCGRRPILALCALCATGLNIGCGFCKSYGALMALRCLSAAFMAPASAIGNIVVTELYFSHQRGSRNGVWALFLTIGPSFGPFLMSFVQQHTGDCRWVFFIFGIMSFAVFLGWMVADETLHLRGDEEGKGVKAWFGIVTKTPYQFRFIDFISPLSRGLDYRIFVTCFAYSICFSYTNVVMTVEMPAVMGQKFQLNAEQTGLQFLSITIGCAIGEILAGPISDFWMKRRIKQRGMKVIEDRLWFSYFGFICMVSGLIVWGVRTQQARWGQWNITPLIGAAIAAVGLQIVTTVLITYMVDLNPLESLGTGLFISFFRQTWSFTGPFYFPQMFDKLGFGGAAGLMAGIVGFAWIWIVIIHLVGVRQQHVKPW